MKRLAFGKWPLAIDFLTVTTIYIFHQTGDEKKFGHCITNF
jgi:hypothetical protein